MLRITSNTNFDGPHQNQPVLMAGADIKDAKAVMIMVHGRGASAESILQFAQEFNHTDKITFIACQAQGNTWYPYSFLAPTEQNQPGLNSGLQAIFNLLEIAKEHGFTDDQIFLLGFSQGGCLASEFVARHPSKYAGLIALSGGVIGDKVILENYTGDLKQTPVFLGCSDIDPHIPLERVNETASVFEHLNAKITKKIYPGMGHTVNEDEIKHINLMLDSII